MKKIALFFFAAHSQLVSAGSMGPICDPENVQIPCETSAWHFSGGALYVQPLVGDSALPGSYITTSPQHRHYISLDPNWSWGFKLEGAYHFNKGNDLNLNWYHTDNGTSANIISAVAPSGLTWKGKVTTSPTWNAVNLEWGQQIDLDASRKIRLHGGAGYAGITTDVKTTLPNFLVRDRNSFFNGYGPRIGVDMFYTAVNGFGIYAKGATALFVGNRGFTDNLNYLSTIYDTTETYIVPELEAKLGAQYTRRLEAHGQITLDMGWMFINYFNAEIYEHQATITRFEIEESNFGIQGPYLELKWLGQIA